MPRLKTRTPQPYDDRGRWYVKVDGQRIPLGKAGTPEAREAYDRLIAEWLSNGRRLPPPVTEDDPLTVTELCVAFMQYVLKRHKPGEVANYQSALRIVRRLYGSQPVTAFGPRALAAVREQMVELNWRRSHINKQASRVRSMFRWGVSREMIESHWYERLKTLEPLRKGEAKREGRTVRPVPREHVRRIRRHLCRQVRALIALQLLTAARPDELVGLRAVDLDTSGAVWTRRYESHKTAHHDKDRALYFGRRSQRILRMFMVPGRDVRLPMFSPRDAAAERYARCRTHGKRKPPETNRTLRDAYCTTTYRSAIQYACRKAGVPKWAPNQLRHAAATTVRSAFGLEHAQAMLGHANMKMSEHYARIAERRAREVAERRG